MVEFCRRHANLLPLLANGQLSLRDQRVRLVQFYSQQGREQLDARFFPKR